MTQRAAPMSLAIELVTAFVLLLTLAFTVSAFFAPVLWFGAAVLMVVCIFCYLMAPVTYAVQDDRLIVNSHIHQKIFAPIVRCSRISEGQLPTLIGLRVFGNGGLFAGTGIFWNRMLGIFRAYITSARPDDLVLVETTDRKIIISPREPQLFVEAFQAAR
jgi:hypothetical protein